MTVMVACRYCGDLDVGTNAGPDEPQRLRSINVS
jgi:hypothetical protein